MGVMPCARKGCDSILCRLYSSEHGYICYDCYFELVEFAKHANFSRIHDVIDAFLKSEKGESFLGEKENYVKAVLEQIYREG